jgi:hypothetical protein
VFVLGEVKSSASVTKEHIPDAAIQVYVVGGVLIRGCLLWLFYEVEIWLGSYWSGYVEIAVASYNGYKDPISLKSPFAD